MLLVCALNNNKILISEHTFVCLVVLIHFLQLLFCLVQIILLKTIYSHLPNLLNGKATTVFGNIDGDLPTNLVKQVSHLWCGTTLNRLISKFFSLPCWRPLRRTLYTRVRRFKILQDLFSHFSFWSWQEFWDIIRELECAIIWKHRTNIFMSGQRTLMVRRNNFILFLLPFICF